MTEDQPEIIVEYPETFPISSPLREVFTERLKTFFQACDTWSCSHDGSLPEKLLKLRREMQESIDYPPMRKTALAPDNVPLDEGEFSPVREDPEARHVRTLVSPEVRLSWKGLQTRSMEKLPPAVRDAGLDLASRVLGVHIRYGRPELCFEHRKNAPVSADLSASPLPALLAATGATLVPEALAGASALHDWQYESECVAPAKTQSLCPFTPPGATSELTKNWSTADRARLRHQIQRHIGMAAIAGLIVGMVLGVVISQANMPHYGGGYSAQRQDRFDSPDGFFDQKPKQPSRSALIAPNLQAITPLPQGWIQPSIQSFLQSARGAKSASALGLQPAGPSADSEADLQGKGN